jgi:hypothetical protein
LRNQPLIISRNIKKIIISLILMISEYSVHQLLANDLTANYIVERLDARYKHILIDEFQGYESLTVANFEILVG